MRLNAALLCEIEKNCKEWRKRSKKVTSWRGWCYLYQASIQVLCHHEDAQFKDEHNLNKLTHRPQTSKGKKKYSNKKACALTLTKAANSSFLFCWHLLILVKVSLLVYSTLSCLCMEVQNISFFLVDLMSEGSSEWFLSSSYILAGWSLLLLFPKTLCWPPPKACARPEHPSKSQQRVLAEILSQNLSFQIL